MIIHFTCTEHKDFSSFQMTTPSIQNDFSYYRRIVSRYNLSSTINEEQNVFKTAESNEQISSELASRMSLFYAQSTPMLKVLSEATMKFVENVSFLWDIIIILSRYDY